MEDSNIRKAWNICELKYLEQFNSHLISPAVFKPDINDDFLFEDNPEKCELWNSMNNIENVSFISEPLEGYYRESIYVQIENDINKISIKTYRNRIKISPADEECSYKAFKYIIEQFEKNVCNLEFLGGLDEMKKE